MAVKEILSAEDKRDRQREREKERKKWWLIKEEEVVKDQKSLILKGKSGRSVKESLRKKRKMKMKNKCIRENKCNGIKELQRKKLWENVSKVKKTEGMTEAERDWRRRSCRGRLKEGGKRKHWNTSERWEEWKEAPGKFFKKKAKKGDMRGRKRVKHWESERRRAERMRSRQKLFISSESGCKNGLQRPNRPSQRMKTAPLLHLVQAAWGPGSQRHCDSWVFR